LKTDKLKTEVLNKWHDTWAHHANFAGEKRTSFFLKGRDAIANVLWILKEARIFPERKARRVPGKCRNMP
jgi:hypothetical protein